MMLLNSQTSNWVEILLFWALIVTTALTPRVAAGFAEQTPLEVSFAERGFSKIASKQGVSVYKHRSADNIRIGADGRVAASPWQVLAAVLDYRHQVGVIDRLSESRVLARGRDWMLVYQRLNLPVISDRDFVLRVRWGQAADGTVWVRYRAVRSPRAPAPKSGVVRITHHQGSWQLRPLAVGTATQVRFQLSIDLSGWLPKWMARAGAGKELPALFGSVRQLINKHGYRRSAWLSN
jgi:START domain